MGLNETQAEPSMEEILASIRRIISEEDEPTPQQALQLSEPARDEFSSGADDALEDLMVFEEEEEAPEAPAFSAAPPPQPVASPAEPAGETILSEPASAAAASAFSKLSGALRISDMHDQTLEGVVRDLLRPMLKEWLDANLPAIVEARVEAELTRIARLSR